ncbi:hypothetical protein BDN72DRAFT_903768 [Pluteus cervinus]|uniref:Uncharacterized protein n=1 Tax=Pluteus cervinus TaxID=181527 RepID=A0ACD3A7X2_9AGAR|nr:hypothetical protein BDN72DRAFT_903768 [Pluteus cervinus]
MRKSPPRSVGIIANLPFEILLIIIRLVYQGNRRASLAFRLVSHTFKALVDPQLFERVTLRTIDGLINFHKLVTCTDVSAPDPPSVPRNTAGCPWQTSYLPSSRFITPSTASTYSIARHIRALCTHQGPPELVAQILCLCVNLRSFAPWGMREEYPHLVARVLEFVTEPDLEITKNLSLDNGYLVPIQLLRLGTDSRIFQVNRVSPARPLPTSKQETHLGVQLVRMREKRSLSVPQERNTNNGDDDEWEDELDEDALFEAAPAGDLSADGGFDHELPSLAQISSDLESDSDLYTDTDTESDFSEEHKFVQHPFTSPVFRSLTHLDLNDPLEWNRLNLIECVWVLPNLTHLSLQAKALQIRHDTGTRRRIDTSSDDDNDSDFFGDPTDWMWTKSERLIAECVSVPSSTPSVFRGGYWVPKDEDEEQGPLTSLRTVPVEPKKIPRYKYESKLHVLLLWTDNLVWPQLDKLEAFLGLLPPDEGTWKNELEEQRWRRWRSSIVVFCETEPDKKRKKVLDRFGGAVDFKKKRFWWEWGYRGGDWDEGLVTESVGQGKVRALGKGKGRIIRLPANNVPKDRDSASDFEEVWSEAEKIVEQRKRGLELDFLAFPCIS